MRTPEIEVRLYPSFRHSGQGWEGLKACLDGAFLDHTRRTVATESDSPFTSQPKTTTALANPRLHRNRGRSRQISSATAICATILSNRKESSGKCRIIKIWKRPEGAEPDLGDRQSSSAAPVSAKLRREPKYPSRRQNRPRN